MLKFGTSGLRGLVAELTDRACYLYTAAFLKYLLAKKFVSKNSSVALAGDLRPSTVRILKAIATAIIDHGFKIDYCGIIPTPAVSLYGFKRHIPSIMVTGSHIPYDRNGIKFNLLDGEILKKDEQAITEYQAKISASGELDSLFKKNGSFKKVHLRLPKANLTAEREFVKRYINFFKKNFLRGKKIVVYEQSSVMRDLMVEILKKLGAKVIRVGRSQKFIPLDTEAIEKADIKKARGWAKKYRADAVVSTDGDGDRPVLFDENGDFIRGDFLDIICAAYLKADSVSATASCNTGLEKCGRFKNVNRTQIGSPYVVAAMQNDKKQGYKKIVSYEANGGFLTGSDFTINARKLPALPTRDSMLPILSALALANENKLSLSQLARTFPQRFVYSNSIKGVPTEISHKILKKISGSNETAKKQAKKLFYLPSEVVKFNFTDGARLFLANGEIVHVRSSGNSPELRVYCEADSLDRARELAEGTLNILVKNK